jgi:hypothetical protein
MMDNTHTTHFLDFRADFHQLGGLKDLVEWPKGITQKEDGTLQGPSGLKIDGWKEVTAGFYIPIIPECTKRLHAVRPDKERFVEFRCTSEDTGKHMKVIDCATCEACPHRQGNPHG